MVSVRFLFAFTLFFLLSSCGGGESSSGGITDPSAVTYVGKQAIVLSAPSNTVSNEATFQIAFTPLNNSVTIEDSDFTVSAIVNGGAYEVSSPSLRFEIDAATTCTGMVSYAGNIRPTTTNGNLSGLLTCNGTPFTVSGTYSAEPVSSKIIPVADSFTEVIKNAF